MQNQNYAYIFEQDSSRVNMSKNEFILNYKKKRILNSNKKNLQLKQSSNFQNQINSQIPILTPKQKKVKSTNLDFQQLQNIRDFNSFFKKKQNLDSSIVKPIKIKKQIHRYQKPKEDNPSNKIKQQKKTDYIDDLEFINLDNRNNKQNNQTFKETGNIQIQPLILKKIDRIKIITKNNYNNHQEQQPNIEQQIILNSLNDIIRSPNFKNQKIIQMQHINNKRQFITSVIPKGFILQCSIQREKSLLKSLYPQFHLYVSSGQYLMSSTKKVGHTRSSYTISLHPNDMNSHSINYLGKLKSNFLGTQFILFDSGTTVQRSEDNRDIRKIIGSMNFKNNKLGSLAKLLQVYLPKFNENSNEKSDFKELYFHDKSKLFAFKNKLPVYNQSTNLFNLNFFGRVNKISTKNFILEQFQTENDEFQYNLLFGKVADDIYHLDVKYPFTPLQAFGTILTFFDYKLAFK